MSASVADKLAEARKLIERGWTQRRYAVDEDGKSVEECSSKAVAFCATGALNRAFGGDEGWWEARDLLSETVGQYITCWNDSHIRTQAEVIEAFRKAEELAREEASK